MYIILLQNSKKGIFKLSKKIQIYFYDDFWKNLDLNNSIFLLFDCLVSTYSLLIYML